MASPQGLLSPVEKQTYEAFGMLPDSERLGVLPRYSKKKGLLAPQFIYDAAKAISSPATAAQGYELGPEEALNVAMTATGGSSVGTAPKGALRSGLQFDPRFDPRKLEQERLKNLKTVVEPTGKIEVPVVSLANYEGRPFVSSMSDRTAAGGNLVKINDVTLNRPVGLLGGQDYMFNNPQVWASAQGPVNQIMKQAEIGKKITGQDPLLLQWRMAPTGGDFAHMTGETMLNYASSAMSPKGKKALDKDVKKFIPDWKGVDSDESVIQFRTQKDSVRKAIKASLDKNFRNEGGLSIGEARLSVADPKQLTAPDAGIMNVGEIYAGQPIIQQSGHPSYPRGVPGQGLGRLEQQHNIFELMPNVVQARGIPNPAAPRQTDIRALQMKPYSGIITADLLKKLGY
jgi:hypothetical protein